MKYVMVLAAAGMLTACHSSKRVEKTNSMEMNEGQPVKLQPVQSGISGVKQGSNAAVSSPVVYIYKMKKDYSQLVPVLMDDSRSRIVSYPHPADLKRGGQLCLPTELVQGYWLDNRGINGNVAFLSYTYAEYAALPAAPSIEDLLAHIVDKYPLTGIWACGRRADYKDIVTELNEKITAGELPAAGGFFLSRD